VTVTATAHDGNPNHRHRCKWPIHLL
jgi:hypothetical protein